MLSYVSTLSDLLSIHGISRMAAIARLSLSPRLSLAAVRSIRPATIQVGFTKQCLLLLQVESQDALTDRRSILTSAPLKVSDNKVNPIKKVLELTYTG